VDYRRRGGRGDTRGALTVPRRSLDYLRAAGVPPDARAEEAIAVVLERRQADGRWLLDLRHRDAIHAEVAGAVGAANRWITLRCLRVLDWHGAARS
jgi:post-segregation antitoxin (ccd killing protein)